MGQVKVKAKSRENNMSSSRSKRQRARRSSIQIGTNDSPLDTAYCMIPYSTMNYIDSSMHVGFLFEENYDKYVDFKNI